MAQTGLLARLIRTRPLVAAAVSYMLGCILCYALNLPACLSLTVLGATLFLALVCAFRLRRCLPFLLILCMLPLGALRFNVSWHKTEPLPDQTGAQLSGRICDIPLYNEEKERTVCVIEGVTLNGEAASGRLRVYLRCGTDDDAQLLLQPQIGDHIECTAHIWRADESTNPGQFNFSNYLRLNGLRGYATAKVGDMMLTEGRLTLSDRRKLFRESIGERVDKLFPSNSAIARSFLIGDRSRLSEEERENYSKSGAAHLLAISGMHISVLAGVLSLLLGRFLGRKSSFGITLALLCVYGLLTGYSASLTRAILMYIVFQAAPLLGRYSDSPTRLCTAMLLYLLVRPEAILDTGFVLSYGASAGIILLTSPMSALLHVPKIKPTEHGMKALLTRRLPRWLLSSVAATAAAQLAILPAIIHSFGAQPAASFAVNLIAVPLAMVAFIIAFLGLLSGIPFVALIADHMFSLLNSCVAFFADLPLASIRVARFPLWLTLICIVICLLSSDLSKLKPALRRFLPLTVILAIPVANFCAHLTTYGFSVVYLDADQADCAVIRSGGEVYLVDTGDDYSPIGDYLSAMNYRPKAIFLSHLHADHTGGLQDILDLCTPETIYIPADTDTFEIAESVSVALNAAEEMGVEIVVLDAGSQIELAGETFADVLAPTAGFPAGSANENSMVLRISNKEHSLLFCGDAPAKQVKKVAENCTVLKIAHHGAKDALTSELLDMIDPEVAIISVGYNTYGHPRKECLELLDERGIDVYRTDHSGAITVRFKDDEICVEQYCPSEDENDRS